MNLLQKTLFDVNVDNKVVLTRVDFNVPIKNGVITDENRIIQSLSTIKFLIEHKAKVVLFSHLGRVEKEEDKAKLSLAPVAVNLSKHLSIPVKFVPFTKGPELEEAIKNLQPGGVLLFENTRFEDIDGKKESKNNSELAKYWASLGEVFVNDAFGTAHRAHASNVGIASNISSSCVGFLVQKELEMLSQALDFPKRPLVTILGGAKVSDKIEVINNLITKADKILIGGGMAFTFLKALGFEVGKSILEADKLDLAKSLLEKANGKIILPIDLAMSTSFKDETPTFTKDQNIDADKMSLDIGPKTIELFQKELQSAKTVVWNGPMGVFEFKNFATGTIAICKEIASLKDVFSLIGGGDSAAAAISLGFEKSFTHISTGGGASLEYMEGKKLPGIEIIQKK